MKICQIGPANDGQRVRANLGDRVELVLPENPTTGYRWQWHTLDRRIEETLEDTFEPPQSDALGVGGRRVFRFRATVPGSHRLVLCCVRAWEPEGQEVARFEVQFDVSDANGDPSMPGL